MGRKFNKVTRKDTGKTYVRSNPKRRKKKK